MEWERCKNILLVFFLILNITLAALLWHENRRYTVTSEQEQIIKTIMFRNQISMYDTLIRQHRPMSSLYVGGFYYSRYELMNIFFAGDIDITHDGDMLIMEDSTGRLIIYESGFITFDNFSRFDGVTPDEFIYKHFPDFVLDSSSGNWLTFRQVYRDRIIHSNTIDIFVRDDNITHIEMLFGQVIGLTGENQEIFSSALALLSFIQSARGIFPDTPIIITRMDLAFFQDYGSPDPQGVYLAVPYYRIFIEGNDMPFLINALTNNVRY